VQRGDHERVIDLARAQPRRQLGGAHQLDKRLFQRAILHLANALTVLGQIGVHAIPEQRGVRVDVAERPDAPRCEARLFEQAAATAGDSPGSTSPPGISSVSLLAPCLHWRTITSSSSGVIATTFTQGSDSIV